MSRWFRHYAGMMRDEKLVRAALRSKQPIERVVWVWGAILESAAEINDGGRFDLEKAEIAHFLRADEADVVSVWSGLEAMGRIRGDIVVKWSDRQFQSDSSRERQRRYREKRGRDAEPNADAQREISDGCVTSPLRHRDAPETETYTETKTEKRDRASRAARLPDDWSLCDKDRSYACDAGFSDSEIVRIAGAFADYHRSRGTRMVDWSAAWRTWVRNEIKFSKDRKNGKSGIIDAADGLVERIQGWGTPGALEIGGGADTAAVRLLPKG